MLGILDLHGEIIPVINLRKRFRLPEREIRSDDQFVVARTRALILALVVDSTESVLEETGTDLVSPEEIVSGTGYLTGVTRTPEGLVLIHNLESLLFPAEEESLAHALEQAK